MTFYSRDFRFKCQRCASLCCRLGGPPLSRNDIDRIKRRGYDAVEFSESTSLRGFGFPDATQRLMKSGENGSCIFLKSGKEEGVHECAIYDQRPALCRLYPFYLETVDSRTFCLKVIPCCRGLNNPDGELVDEKFFFKHLHKAVTKLLASDASQKSSNSRQRICGA